MCALPSGQVDQAMQQLGCHADVVTLDPHTIDDILDDHRRCGRCHRMRPRADALVAGLRARLATIADRVAGKVRPRVFVLEWPDPPFVAGHWVPELVEAAGGDAVLATAGERSVPTTWADVAAVDPDIVIVSSCGFDAAGSAVHADEVLEHLPGRARVWAIDANGLMVRPGPRVVDGVDTLARSSTAATHRIRQRQFGSADANFVAATSLHEVRATKLQMMWRMSGAGNARRVGA